MKPSILMVTLVLLAASTLSAQYRSAADAPERFRDTFQLYDAELQLFGSAPSLLVYEMTKEYLYPVEAVTDWGDGSKVTVTAEGASGLRVFEADLTPEGDYAASTYQMTSTVMEYGEQQRYVIRSHEDNGGWFYYRDGDESKIGSMFKESGRLAIHESRKNRPFGEYCLSAYNHLSHRYLLAEDEEVSFVQQGDALTIASRDEQDPFQVELQFNQGRPSILSIETEHAGYRRTELYAGHFEFGGRLYPELIIKEKENLETSKIERTTMQVIACREMTVEEFADYFSAEDTRTPPLESASGE